MCVAVLELDNRNGFAFGVGTDHSYRFSIPAFRGVLWVVSQQYVMLPGQDDQIWGTDGRLGYILKFDYFVFGVDFVHLLYLQYQACGGVTVRWRAAWASCSAFARLSAITNQPPSAANNSIETEPAK